MNAWTVIALAGAGSYLLRISMLVLAARAEVPAVARQAGALAVPVAFAGLAAGALATQTVEAGAGAVPALVSVAVGVAAVRRTGASHAAILAGMPTMWLLSALVPR
jgi:branched-subunit amino acid transport protein